MRKGFVWFLALVALAGFINCVLVEPAFTCEEDVAGSVASDSHGCMVCNAAGHQWIAPYSSALFFKPDLAHAVHIPFLEISAEPPLESIFHPPTVF